MFPIQISLTHALALYSAIFGVIIIVIWIVTEISGRRTRRGLERQHLWRCTFCGYVYLDEGAQDLSKCPRCQSFNALDDHHARYVKPRRTRKAAEASETKEHAARSNPSRHKRPGQKRRGPRSRRR